MAATTTKIGIINRALQLLGSQSINSLSEGSNGAKVMLRAYDSIFLSELRKHTWNFAIKRASLAEDATAPIFGKAHSYPLPGDFLFLAPEETTFYNPDRRDYNVEGSNIISSLSPPLAIRYVSSNITESAFDVLFAEAMAHALAVATCEEITNSNTKLQNLSSMYENIVSQARKRNAFENAPVKAPTCSFITVRS